MAKSRYQKIEVLIWNDEKFVQLTADEKYLFMYLLTSPHSNCLGAFIMKPGYAADDLGWDRQQYLETLNGLSVKGFVTVDLTLYLTVVNNYLRHNPPDNQNQFKAILKMLVSLPKSPVLNSTIAYLQGLTKRFDIPLPDGFGEPFTKPVTVAVTVAVTERTAAAGITSEGDLKEGTAKGVVEEAEKEKTEAGQVLLVGSQEHMPVSEALDLSRKSLGRLMETPGQVTVLQDICRDYSPERIREAFAAAQAAAVQNLGWVVKRLEARGRDSPRMTRDDERRERNHEAAREFCAEVEG